MSPILLARQLLQRRGGGATRPINGIDFSLVTVV